MTPNEIDGGGKWILVIDDDVAIRILLRAVFQRLDCNVELAEDGASALNMMKQRKYSLLLLDLMMPVMDGYQVLESFRKSASDPYPHVLVFTATGNRGIAKLPPDSVCGSIQKPFDLEHFLELIAECIGQKHKPK